MNNRLREDYGMYGAGSLSTADLLALLLSHHRPVSARTVTAIARLLDAYGIRGLRQVGEHDLVEQGLTSAQAQTLQVVCDLAARLALPDAEKPLIAAVDDAVALLRPFMESLDHEEFRVLILDTKNQVVANVLLYQGTVNCCPLRASEIFRHAIIRNCPRVIVAHCHPSGNASASEEDRMVTLKLVEAGRLLDVELLDHIIIGRPGYVSLKTEMKWI